MERQRLEQELASLGAQSIDLKARTEKIVELAKSADHMYETGDPAQKRRLLEILLSNCVAGGKDIEFSLVEPFATFAERNNETICAQYYYTDRTFSAQTVIRLVSEIPAKVADAIEAVTLPNEVTTV